MKFVDYMFKLFRFFSFKSTFLWYAFLYFLYLTYLLTYILYNKWISRGKCDTSLKNTLLNISLNFLKNVTVLGICKYRMKKEAIIKKQRITKIKKENICKTFKSFESPVHKVKH